MVGLGVPPPTHTHRGNETRKRIYVCVFGRLLDSLAVEVSYTDNQRAQTVPRWRRRLCSVVIIVLLFEANRIKN